jgi:hypothetical protein
VLLDLRAGFHKLSQLGVRQTILIQKIKRMIDSNARLVVSLIDRQVWLFDEKQVALL